MLIATANAKGGTGKTTIATHLAHWFFLYEYKTLLVDCDAQRLSSRWLVEAEPDLPTLVLERANEIDETLPKLREQYDVVIIDAPGGLGKTTGAVLSHVNAVLIPTGASNLEIMALEWVVKTVQEIQRLGRADLQGAIVPAKVGKGRLTTKNLLTEANKLGISFTNSILPYREIYAQVSGLANRSPKLLWQLGRSKPVRQAALEMDALFQELFPEACQHDPTRIERLITPAAVFKRNTNKKNSNGQRKKVVNA